MKYDKDGRLESEWSNYETELAALWIDMDKSDFLLLKIALESKNTNYQRAVWLSHQIKDWLWRDIGRSCLEWDLLMLSFEKIQWIEIIENNQSDELT